MSIKSILACPLERRLHLWAQEEVEVGESSKRIQIILGVLFTLRNNDKWLKWHLDLQFRWGKSGLRLSFQIRCCTVFLKSLEKIFLIWHHWEFRRIFWLWLWKEVHIFWHIRSLILHLNLIIGMYASSFPFDSQIHALFYSFFYLALLRGQGVETRKWHHLSFLCLQRFKLVLVNRKQWWDTRGQVKRGEFPSFSMIPCSNAGGSFKSLDFRSDQVIFPPWFKVQSGGPSCLNPPVSTFPLFPSGLHWPLNSVIIKSFPSTQTKIGYGLLVSVDSSPS